MAKDHEVEKVWESKEGLTCVVIMTRFGHRCGYVGVPTKHPLYGKAYDKSCRCLVKQLEQLKQGPIGKRGIIPVVCWDGKKATPEIVFDVHGGLTYSSRKKGDDHPISQRGTWWFGYDCAHAGDAKDLSVADETIRELEARFPTGGVIRTLEYCVAECESLSEQLAAVKK